jgi:osmotically-inducible protein OsmY
VLPDAVRTPDIVAALRRAGLVDASEISVAVDGSAVTLSGTVDSWAERDRATRAAGGAPGVARVIDKLRLAA